MAFFVWLLAFRDYFSGRLPLFSDAISYFDHTHYYLESLKHGVFPLWDHFWNQGSPNEFFLRRLGVYNPIYLWMFFLNLLGAPYVNAYLLTQSLYFLLGAVGFYLLVRAIYRDERVAFSAFLLFLFSAMGTRIFDSYMCLVIVPTVWFFYFVYSFLSLPGRRSFAGLCLSLMIAFNTYIPLFFLTIVLAAGIFWAFLFPRELLGSLRRVAVFCLKQRLFCALMVFLLVLAFIPPIAFFLEAARGGLAMPERHGASGMGHVLGVDTKLLYWGVMEDLYFTSFFLDLTKFRLALVYVPLLSVFLWAGGALCRINRRIVLYFMIGIFFLLLGTPLAAPLYHFLYQHVFYFKYIRNLHFFLWFILLPLFILIAAEFLSQLLKLRIDTTLRRWAAVIVVVALHAGCLAWILARGDGIPTTFFVIGASLALGLWYTLGPGSLKGWVLWLTLLCVIAPQAVQVFYYATHNMPREMDYEYEGVRTSFQYVTRPAIDSGQEKVCGSLYYSTSGFYDLCDKVSPLAFASARTHKLVAYGHVEPFHNTADDYAHLNWTLAKGANIAFVSGGKDAGSLAPQGEALFFEKDSSILSTADFNPNRLKLRANFPQEKFLVYFDNNAPGWRAFVDGKRVPLYTADIAFKGVRVPAGERTVEFRYGSPWWYAFNWFLLLAFNGIFYAVVWAFWRKGMRLKLSGGRYHAH
ncbi:MAG: hypothetical protein HQL18_00060 [Candidatus Omnitrophica bacterium]|nr:hypothetical protein [Candidatus Omnitrophota bacterium]